MHLQFKISEIDFLTFQLYTLSKSEKVQQRMKRGRIFATILGVILAFNLFITDAMYAGIVMVVGIVLIYYFYPQYHKWRMKRNFANYIKHNYNERFDKEEELTVHDKGILSKNISGEGEIPKSELTKLIEIQELFLIGMTNGAAIILPKNEVSEASRFKSALKNIGVGYVAELDWKY